MEKLLEQIAKKHLPVETLKVRGSDHLDFYAVSVWGIRNALEEAYEQGRAEGYNLARTQR